MPDALRSRCWSAPSGPGAPCRTLANLAVALVAAAGCAAPFSLPSGEELLALRPAGGQRGWAEPGLARDGNLLGEMAARVLGTRPPGRRAGQANGCAQAAGGPRWARAALVPDRRDSAIIRTSAQGPAEPDVLAANDPGDGVAEHEHRSMQGDILLAGGVAGEGDRRASGALAGSGGAAAQTDALAGQTATDLATEGLVSLTLDEALDYARCHHPLLAARSHEVAAAKGALAGAGLLPNPELTMDTDVPVNEGRGADLRVRLMFTLPTGGKRRLREAVAAAGVARARWALKSETERVLLAANDVGLEVLYLQELARLQAELSALAARRAEIERSRFEARTATYADAMEAEMDAARLALEHKTTLAQLRAARWSLGEAIGLSPAQPVHLVGELAFEPFEAVPLEQVLAQARASRPELPEARAALSESCRELALARAEAKPDIGIGPRYEDHLGDGNDSAGARLDIELPLFDRNQGAIGESAGLARAAGAMVKVAELNTLGDVAREYVRLLSLQSWLDHYQSQVMPIVARTQAALAEEEARRALPADQASDILRAVIRLRLDELRLRYEYNLARRRLEIFLGQGLEDLGLLPGAAVEQLRGEAGLPGEPMGSGAEAALPSIGLGAAAPRAEADGSVPGLPGLPGVPELAPLEPAEPAREGPTPELLPLPGLGQPAAGRFEGEAPTERPLELEDSAQRTVEHIGPPEAPPELEDSAKRALKPFGPPARPGGAPD